MKKFYVECGDRDWIITADDSVLNNGCLFFLREKVLVAAFNVNSWDAIRVMEEEPDL